MRVRFQSEVRDEKHSSEALSDGRDLSLSQRRRHTQHLEGRTQRNLSALAAERVDAPDQLAAAPLFAIQPPFRVGRYADRLERSGRCPHESVGHLLRPRDRQWPRHRGKDAPIYPEQYPTSPAPADRLV